MQEYAAAMGCLFFELSTKVLKRSTLKVCLRIVDGLLERRNELVGLVASVQKSMKEEPEFLLYVLYIRAKLVDAKDVPKDQAWEDTRSMAGVWRQVEMKCHRFGVEGGLDVFPLNLQAQFHEYHLLRSFAEDPAEPTRIHAILEFYPVLLIRR